MRGGKALNRKQEEDTRNKWWGRVTRVSFSIKANLGLSFKKWASALWVWVFIFMGFFK